MKRKLAIFLAGLMVISCIGCGAPKDDVTTQESSSATVTTENEPTKDSQESQVAPEASKPEEPAITEEYQLKKLFEEHGMKAGTCLTTQMIKDAKTSKLILEQFNSATMENSMKPDYLFNRNKSVEAGDLVVEFNQDMITMLDWAKENNMSLRGHTLIWYSQTPVWIFYEDFNAKKSMVGRDVMLARMESYIKQVFEKLEEGGYADLFYAYDVANEAWMEDGSIRQNNWTATIGEDYLWYAFYYANKYAPEHIDLYYNDYNEQFKDATFVKFVNTLKDDEGNYLIDGIGLQAHLYTEDSLPKYFSAVDTLAATGLKLQLTELDVCLGAYQKVLAATDTNLKAQGKFYYDLINGLFERVDEGKIKMDALTFWGFADNMSWRKEQSPLLYDKNLRPKYAYYGAMQMKEEAGITD